MNFLTIRLFVFGLLLFIGLPYACSMQKENQSWSFDTKIKMPNEETIQERLKEFGLDFFYSEAFFLNKTGIKKGFKDKIANKTLSIEKAVYFIETVCRDFLKRKSDQIDQFKNNTFIHHEANEDMELLKCLLERNLILYLEPLIIKGVLLKDYPKAIEAYEKYCTLKNY